MNNPFVGSVNGAIGSDAALPARSDQVWKCIVSVGPMLIRIRRTSTSLARCASEGYRLLPPCSMVGIWNAAVVTIACKCASGVRSLSVRGIAVNCPWCNPGMACGKTKLGIEVGIVRIAAISRIPAGIQRELHQVCQAQDAARPGRLTALQLSGMAPGQRAALLSRPGTRSEMPRA